MLPHAAMKIIVGLCREGIHRLSGLSGYSVDYKSLVVIITTMNSKQIIKRLEADGWVLARVKGSHHQFRHPTKPGLVTIKHPDSDIPAGTLNSIKKQADWK